MANVKLIFSGTTESESQDKELQCYLNTQNEIFIQVGFGYPNSMNENWICLDKSTAIKFAKTLRTEINKMED